MKKRTKNLTFPRTIKYYRLLRGYKSSEVAKILGVSRQTYFGMENDERKMIRVEHLHKLCDLFRVKTDDMVPREQRGK